MSRAFWVKDQWIALIAIKADLLRIAHDFMSVRYPVAKDKMSHICEGQIRGVD